MNKSRQQLKVKICIIQIRKIGIKNRKIIVVSKNGWTKKKERRNCHHLYLIKRLFIEANLKNQFWVR